MAMQRYGYVLLGIGLWVASCYPQGVGIASTYQPTLSIFSDDPQPPADPPPVQPQDPVEPAEPSKPEPQKPDTPEPVEPANPKSEPPIPGKEESNPQSEKPRNGNWLSMFTPQHLREEFKSKVTITGRKSMGFHVHQVSGDSQAFRDQNYYGEGGKRFTDNTDLSIRVNKLFDILSFDWRWANNRFANPWDARVTWSYDSKNFKMELGDITASLQGNDLVGFSRTLKGATFTTRTGTSQFKYVTSETKAAARTITLAGNDSSGPYYLQASQIVDGSERVRVDNIEKQRGVDYTIDYYSGILNFREGLIIPRTSTLVITYETYAYNSGASRIDGWRFESPLARGINFGFTSLKQTSQSGSGLRTRTEQFYGRGTPTTPYDLEFIPLVDATHRVTVLVGGAPQQEEIDYYFDPVLPYRFYFKRFMPPTLIVQVTYIPRPDPGSSIGGNRQVYGMDLTLPLSRYGRLAWNGALSQLANTGNSVNGNAHIVDMKFQYGRLSLGGVYRDIPSEFISIESIGFRRNETGYQTDLAYDLGRGMSLKWSSNKAKVASLFTGGTGLNSSFTDTNVQTFNFNWTPERGPSVSLSRVMNNADSTNTRTRQANDTLRLSQGWKNLTLSLDLNRIQANQRVSSSSSPLNTSYNILSTRLGAEWKLNDRFSISGVAALSRIGETARTSRARDTSLNLNWTPWSSLTVRYSWRDNDSGSFQLSNMNPLQTTSGFQNGWGAGYNGNGFSSGAPSFGSGFSTLGTQGKGQTLSVNWTPTDNFSIDAQLSLQRSAGDFQTNSSMRGMNLNANFSPWEWLSLNTGWSRQEVQFLSSEGRSDNDYLYASVEVGPLKRWSLTLGFFQMTSSSVLSSDLSGSPGQYSQNPSGLSALLNYQLAARQKLFLDWQGSQIKGYLASREYKLEMGYQYDITSYLALVISYRIREQRNLDPEFSQYSYRARSLDAQLQLQF
jgi:hypothetical protein